MDLENIFSKALEASKRGDLDEAERLYIEALKISELPEIWNNLGNVYRRKGLLAKAVDSFKRALEMDPNYKTALLNLALTFLDLERYGEALMIAKRLEGEGFESNELKIVMAVSLAKLGRYAEFMEVKKKLGRDFDHILRDYGIDMLK